MSILSINMPLFYEDFIIKVLPKYKSFSVQLKLFLIQIETNIIKAFLLRFALVQWLQKAL